MINRLNFIKIIENAMCQTCTEGLVLKSFSTTGVLPFDPTKIDLEQFPSSLATQSLSSGHISKHLNTSQK